MKCHNIKAKITGSVNKIHITKGDNVNQGQELIIMESMKMEFPIDSNVNGIIKDVLVSEGDNVSEGDILIKIEESK